MLFRSNRQRHEQSVVVMPTQLLSPWTQNRFDALTEEDLKALISLGQEVVLLGTGSKLRFPPPHLLRPLASAGIGIEVMDVRAACRTYNILVAEERKVAAALLIE